MSTEVGTGGIAAPVSEMVDNLVAAASSAAAEIVIDLLDRDGRRVVDVLGKLVDRLPDALSVAEVVLVLDRFDVALRGHSSSPSVDAYGPESRVASDSIVGDASGAVETPSAPASDAPSTSEEVSS